MCIVHSPASNNDKDPLRVKCHIRAQCALPDVTIMICYKTSNIGANRYIVINIAKLKSHFKIIFLSSKLICLGRCWQTQKQIPWWQSSNFLRIIKGKLKFALHILLIEFYKFIYLSKTTDFVYLYQPSSEGGTCSPPATPHRLQNPKWPPWGPKMADGVRKGVYP